MVARNILSICFCFAIIVAGIGSLSLILHAQAGGREEDYRPVADKPYSTRDSRHCPGLFPECILDGDAVLVRQSRQSKSVWPGNLQLVCHRTANIQHAQLHTKLPRAAHTASVDV